MSDKFRRDLGAPRGAAVMQACRASATARHALYAKIAPTIVIRRTSPVGAGNTQPSALTPFAIEI